MGKSISISFFAKQQFDCQAKYFLTDSGLLASFCFNFWKDSDNFSQRKDEWNVDLCLDLVPLVPSTGF